MRLAYVTLLFLLARPLVAHAATEAQILEQCSGASQAGMRDCLEKRAIASQHALRDTEKKTAEAIAAWDEDKKFIGGAQARLTAATQAFERYREAQCALSASLGGGAVGNALALRRLSCASQQPMRCKSNSCG